MNYITPFIRKISSLYNPEQQPNRSFRCFCKRIFSALQTVISGTMTITMTTLSHKVLHNEPLPSIQEHKSLSHSQIIKITALTIMAAANSIIFCLTLISLINSRRNQIRRNTSLFSQKHSYALEILNLEGSSFGFISIISFLPLSTLHSPEAHALQKFSTNTSSISITIFALRTFIYLFMSISNNQSDTRNPSLHISAVQVRRNSDDSFVETSPNDFMSTCIIDHCLDCNYADDNLFTEAQNLLLEEIISRDYHETAPEISTSWAIDFNNYNPEDYDPNPFTEPYCRSLQHKSLSISSEDDLSNEEEEEIKLHEYLNNPFIYKNSNF
ncbi:hypothetical protein CLAVI_000539 [Candidatus Clavichlamydia salmonicola]|uniref:hypothetical protein n=1 Tax=Candidatus Clavichlamydia salmonicola TaxID=469812 RepID=UPI001891E1ED|nr:hypothetical protein [Candidatus Clavichlamydia salmonicola]MBF5050917.1 hypothetical protein [Candidatus Clavichlamydia salmonicola]